MYGAPQWALADTGEDTRSWHLSPHHLPLYVHVAKCLSPSCLCSPLKLCMRPLLPFNTAVCSLKLMGPLSYSPFLFFYSTYYLTYSVNYIFITSVCVIFPYSLTCLIPPEQGSLFCSLVYPKCLKQGLIQNKISINDSFIYLFI